MFLYNTVLILQDDEWYEQATDVRSQLKFFEQLERLEKQRKDEQEREILLKAAKVSGLLCFFSNYLTIHSFQTIIKLLEICFINTFWFLTHAALFMMIQTLPDWIVPAFSRYISECDEFLGL